MKALITLCFILCLQTAFADIHQANYVEQLWIAQVPIEGSICTNVEAKDNVVTILKRMEPTLSNEELVALFGSLYVAMIGKFNYKESVPYPFESELQRYIEISSKALLSAEQMKFIKDTFATQHEGSPDTTEGVASTAVTYHGQGTVAAPPEIS